MNSKETFHYIHTTTSAGVSSQEVLKMRDYKNYKDIQTSKFLATMSLVTGLSVFPSVFSDRFQKFQVRYVQMEIFFLVAIYLSIMYMKFVDVYPHIPWMFSIADFIIHSGLICTNVICILFTAVVRKKELQYFTTSATEINQNCDKKYARNNILKRSRFLYFHIALLVAVILGALFEVCYVWRFGYKALAVAIVKYIHMLVPLQISIEFAYNCSTVQNYVQYLNARLLETFSYINKARTFAKKNKRILGSLYGTCDTNFFLINYDKVFDMERNVCKLYGIQILGILFLQFVTTVDGVYTVLQSLYHHKYDDGLTEWMFLKLVWSVGNITVSVLFSSKLP